MATTALPSLDSPDYNWQLITAMVSDNTPPSRRVEDKGLRTGFRFMKRMRKANAREVRNLNREYPDFSEVYNLHEREFTVNWLLEACLLTEASYETISDYIGKSVEVVKLYEEIFYNVRPKLEHRGFVLNHILFPAVYRGMDGRDFDFLYKTLGFCGGWDVLTEFIEVKEMDPDVEAWVTGSLNSRVKKLSWIAAYRVDVTQYNAVEIITKGLELQALERESGGSVAQQQGVEAMKSLLQHCKMTIMPVDTDVVITSENRAASLMGSAPKQLQYGDDIPVHKGA